MLRSSRWEGSYEGLSCDNSLENRVHIARTELCTIRIGMELSEEGPFLQFWSDYSTDETAKTQSWSVIVRTAGGIQ